MIITSRLENRDKRVFECQPKARPYHIKNAISFIFFELQKFVEGLLN